MPDIDPNFPSVTVLAPLINSNVNLGALAGVTVTVSGGAFTTARYKFTTGSYELYGVTDYIRVDTAAALPAGTEAFTVESWINIDTWVNPVGTLANLYQSTNQGWRLSVLNTGRVRLEALNDYTSILHPTTLSLDTWIHWAVTRDANGLCCWINGVPSDYLATGASYTASYLFLGAPGWSTTSDEMDAFYNELRVSKGLCRYSAPFTPPTAPFPRYGAVIEGVVTDADGNPAQRTLRCYLRNTGALVGSATSDPASGLYTLGVGTAGEYQIVALDDAAGDELNDLIRRVLV